MTQPLGPLQLKWVEALESGDYLQGREYLCQVYQGEAHWCLLGVACDLYSKAKNDTGVVAFGNHWDTRAIPYSVKRKLKMTDKAPGGLTYLNDFAGKTFMEIASIMRNNTSRFFEEPV